MTPEQREELAACPFCGCTMEPFGPAQHNHPRNDCWLSSVKVEAHEYELWNRRAQVEALTVPQWISVEDRLPPEYERVLTSGAKRVGMAVMQYSDRDDWQIETPSYWNAAYPPKFWMLLPNPPEITK
jgi:hypothetical protein